MSTSRSLAIALCLFIPTYPAAAEGFLSIVAGDSWARWTLPTIERYLDRDLVDDTVGGLRAAEVVADPSIFTTPQPGDMVWLSLGTIGIFDGLPREEREANLIIVIGRILAVPWTRVIHVGYNGDTLEDPYPATRAALQALWPDRYIWIDMRHLDQEPIVFFQPTDPFHLVAESYELRVGAVLSKLTLHGWRP